MPITTVEGAVDQLKRCRSDWDTQVRARRAQAREMLTAATSLAATIRANDAEAVAYLQGVVADAATPAALKTRLSGELAFHARAKSEQAAEE